ncbi:MAG: hypothetical protein C7B46_11195 [Sulfobacillus benefaciens]|uniref:Methyltransferase type 11 domain-containing protein n=1 Tax=Sulfobacillus benefaciens TaxID=453960 RepID=A0A2T2XF45_9FIRM|nr:MAG: hypothetical protein C7B46_11195 [Sulfobacillus benefaciens]
MPKRAKPSLGRFCPPRLYILVTLRNKYLNLHLKNLFRPYLIGDQTKMGSIFEMVTSLRSRLPIYGERRVGHNVALIGISDEFEILALMRAFPDALITAIDIDANACYRLERWIRSSRSNTVSVVHADATQLTLKHTFDAVVASFVLGSQFIGRPYDALKNWSTWLADCKSSLFISVWTAPFVISSDFNDHRTDEILQAALTLVQQVNLTIRSIWHTTIGRPVIYTELQEYLKSSHQSLDVPENITSTLCLATLSLELTRGAD